MWLLRNSIESADYDDRAFNSRIPLQRYWQRKRFRIVLGYLESDRRTIDIGCGSSRIIQNLPNAVAVDVSLPKLRYLKPTNPWRVQASTFSLPFRSGTFDQCILSQVLEHIPHRHLVFEELNRVLRPGGILVIGTPDYGRIWWTMIEFCYKNMLPNAYGDEHITQYTRESLSKHLILHGFEILEYDYIAGGELIMKAKKTGHPCQA